MLEVIDHIFTIREIQVERYERGIENTLCVCGVYDRIASIHHIRTVGGKMIGLTLQDTKNHVRATDKESRFHQFCLSMLWEELCRTKINSSSIVYRNQSLEFAEDITLVTRVKNMMIRVKEQSGKIGLVKNESKTKRQYAQQLRIIAGKHQTKYICWEYEKERSAE